MSRAIFEACVPCLIAMAVAFLLLWCVMKLSGARLNWRRLRALHRCEDGGVQSLAFVLTLPLFMMISLFIVQVSQLMVGIMVVHYSAYTAARSAIVWLPARVDDEDHRSRNRLNDATDNGTYIHFWRENNSDPWTQQTVTMLPPPFRRHNQNVLGGVDTGSGLFSSANDPHRVYAFPPNSGPGSPGSGSSDASFKFEQIRTAAVLSCATIAPSRDLGLQSRSFVGQSLMDTVPNIYRILAPRSSANTRLDQRWKNKIAYSDQNTMVQLSWVRIRNGEEERLGATYNPRTFRTSVWPHPQPMPDRSKPLPLNYLPEPGIVKTIPHEKGEIGWQDAVTVHVVHRFALLPGPGRFLAKFLVPTKVDLPPEVRTRLSNLHPVPSYSEPVRTVTIPASATMTMEGFKSIRSYNQQGSY